MGKEARINKQLKAAKAKSPEALAEQTALEKKQDAAWSSQMAPRLLAEKRGMSGALVARFARPWLEKTLDELKSEVASMRDAALAIAYSRASIEAHRAAMTLVAFEADFNAGGVERLVGSVERELPIKLYLSNDAERLKAERLERATRVAHEAYRLALVEVLAEVSLLDSIAHPHEAYGGAPGDSPGGPVSEITGRALGQVAGVEVAQDADAPMELRDVEEVHELGCDMGEDCSCGAAGVDVSP